jgi:predicted acyltransferase
LWGIWFPINKRMWTSSYVLFAAGWTLLALAISFFLIEIKNRRGAWTFPWKVFGANALFSYALSELLSATLDHIHFSVNGQTITLQNWIYSRIFSPIISPSFGSLLYSLCFVLVCFVPAVYLFRKQIFVKV